MIDRIRIDGPGRPIATGRTPPAATSGFSVSETGGDTTRAKPAEAMAAVGLDGMLAVQEAADAEERDRRARRHGRLLLAELAALQRELLSGGDASLQHLAELAEAVPVAADPALAAVMRGIVLRARVEIARRGP
jgi:hypothetical protein